MVGDSSWDLSGYNIITPKSDIEKVKPTVFEEFKEEVIGDRKTFSSQRLKEAKERGLISPEEYVILLEIYADETGERNKHLEEVAFIDHLTGLPNLGSFEETVQKLEGELIFEGGKRAPSFSDVVFITIDMKGLKEFNKYGQNVGNQALQAFAERLKKVIHRQYDKVFRIGGDEFMIVMPIQNVSTDFDFSSTFEGILKNVESDLSITVQIDSQDGVKNSKNLPIGAYMGYTIFKKGKGNSIKEVIEESAKNMARYKSNFKGEESPISSSPRKK